MNPRSLGKFAIIFIRRISKIFNNLVVTSIFHETSSFDSQMNYRPLINLANIEKSDVSVINQQNGIHSEEAQKYDALNKICKKNSKLDQLPI